MHVVATAGHVDHGKSTLVRALTGMEPDRWAEERRRGMTIDLGYAWTTLPSGAELAFVDVPGHQRFIGNMLAGLGPAPAVLFVVAADEGWSRQSSEHLAAIDALRLSHGLLAVTRSDLADPEPALADSLARIARSSLGMVTGLAVSGTTGAGLPALRTALDKLVAGLPEPEPAGRIRLWVDRSFTVRGSGTVLTGTLGSGTVRIGDTLQLHGETVTVRGVQSLNQPRETVSAVARVALNLRGVGREQVRRGDVLVTPDAWAWTSTLDVRLTDDSAELPAELVLHLGTAAVAVRLRALDRRHARLTLNQPLPVQAGDRAILRDPGRQAIAAGLLVLDPDPPALNRRGAAAARATELASAGAQPDPIAEVRRRGAVRRDRLAALGVPVERLDEGPSEVCEVAGWLISADIWQRWLAAVGDQLDRWAADHPLEPGMPAEALRQALGVPDRQLLPALVRQAGAVSNDGRIARPGQSVSLGAAERSVAAVESRLAKMPFAAPDLNDLAELRLGHRELAAAERAGRLLRVTEDVVLLPDAPQRAIRRLAQLPQPFTLSEARQALDTTRRVAVPLLEYLDAKGRTKRVDASRRRVVPETNND
jgi:selenocysteine-specific elongation factor